MTTPWISPHAWLENLVHAAGLDGLAILDLNRLQDDPTILAGDVAAFDAWLACGAAGGMSFMHENREARSDARLILPHAQTALIFFVPYATGKRVRRKNSESPAPELREPEPKPSDDNETIAQLSGDRKLGEGLIARYAQGSDYHRVLRATCNALSSGIAAKLNLEKLHARAVTDSVPWLERAHARAAGLGFIGKNTMLIRPGVGSFGFIASLLLDVNVESLGSARDKPPAVTSLDCGDCRICLDACPTGALPKPYFLDASRCLSYQSIEHRGHVPREFRKHFSNTVYGCDICQEVCPYNFVTLDLVRQPQLRERHSGNHRTVVELARMTQSQYEAWFGGTAMTRAKFRGLVRNALYSLEASDDPRLVDILNERACDPEHGIAEIVSDLLTSLGQN